MSTPAVEDVSAPAGFILDKDWRPVNGQIVVLNTNWEQHFTPSPFGVVSNVRPGIQKFQVTLIAFDVVNLIDYVEFAGQKTQISLRRAIPNPESGKRQPVSTEVMECKFSRAKNHSGWKVRPFDGRRDDFAVQCSIANYDATKHYYI